MKELNVNNSKLYEFLENIGIDNVVLPNRNLDNQFVTKHNDKYYSIKYRTGWNNTYITSWDSILDSSNYNQFTVKKDGTGASGTWGINVTGNAATATKLQTKRKLLCSELY